MGERKSLTMSIQAYKCQQYAQCRYKNGREVAQQSVSTQPIISASMRQ